MTDENSCKSVWNKVLNTGIIWISSQKKSACPPYMKKKKIEEEPKNDLKPSDEDKKFDSTKKFEYKSPTDFCSPIKSCCYIKMQDPCRACCCEEKPKPPPPCPPKCGPQVPREPVCGCDLCQKHPGHEKCCDKNRAFRGIDIHREYFEKA
ncbi:late cornified envelope-like proline-rich protein 1 [Apis laboriosa]|uniref:late cornified envelope-like proline-rich protein 1 n=1 Tax=Apis laboriosa TaxID=183418 RepID=UPI001CC71152|nr:late cornified envelope-like proline-rich protein 1 [Apis laboriosa]